jgi:hypothetical protein
MILIYLPAITNRARYIFRLFFEDLIPAEFTLTESTEEFNSHKGPRINYSMKKRGDGIFIKAGDLLNKKDIINFPVTIAEIDGLPVMFTHDDPDSDFSFDPFAAAFYLVCRFEEYAAFRGDRYGRFRYEESLIHKGNCIRKPIVNLWAELVKNLILQRYPQVRFREKKYRFIPTIDIDHAYAFGHRSFSRTIGGFTRDIGEMNFSGLLRRTRVLLGKEKDPYDNYELIRNIHEASGVKALYFILFADYGKNDNNVSVQDKEFRALIKELDSHGEVGIHPSLSSNREPRLLKKEISRLNRLLGRNVIRSRQHFLKFSFPKTFRNLIRYEITHDYSMGYASEPGFRAGIADPFRFFNLSENEETDLVIHPVTVMDVSLKDYKGLNPEQSLERICSLVDTVRSVNGEFISLWHNESFSEMERWHGWRRVYEEMVKYAAC